MDATVALIGDLVAEGLLVDEDAVAIEASDGKTRWFGAAGVAPILGGLDAKGVAAELARATACRFSLGFVAEPTAADEFEP